MSDIISPEDLHLPDDVVDALISTAREMEPIETWLPKSQGVLMHIVPRAIRILNAALTSFPERLLERRTIRQNTLHILSYARADIRLMTIFDLSVNAPEALHDLLSGEIDPEYVVHRYNLVTALGFFARHGLINGVTHPDRVQRTQSAIMRARRMRKNVNGEDAA